MACVSTARLCLALVPGGSTKITWLAHCKFVPLALCFELRSSTRGGAASPALRAVLEKAAIAEWRVAASPWQRTANTPASSNVRASSERHSSNAEKTAPVTASHGQSGPVGASQGQSGPVTVSTDMATHTHGNLLAWQPHSPIARLPASSSTLRR